MEVHQIVLGGGALAGHEATLAGAIDKTFARRLPVKWIVGTASITKNSTPGAPNRDDRPVLNSRIR